MCILRDFFDIWERIAMIPFLLDSFISVVLPLNLKTMFSLQGSVNLEDDSGFIECHQFSFDRL